MQIDGNLACLDGRLEEAVQIFRTMQTRGEELGLSQGVIMNLKGCMELGQESGVTATQLSLSGSGARSAAWQQIVADIFGINVVRNSVDEGPAFGAAILAAVGTGLFNSVEEACTSFIRAVDSRAPEPARSQVYGHLYDLYRPIYATLRDFFNSNAAFVEDVTQ